MNPYLELQKLLGPQGEGPISGKIVARLDGGRYQVQTSRRAIEAVAQTNVAFRVGDSVSVRGSVILGRTKSEDLVPTYRV